jgi:hypothetical protein
MADTISNKFGENPCEAEDKELTSKIYKGAYKLERKGQTTQKKLWQRT